MLVFAHRPKVSRNCKDLAEAAKAAGTAVALRSSPDHWSSAGVSLCAHKCLPSRPQYSHAEEVACAFASELL